MKKTYTMYDFYPSRGKVPDHIGLIPDGTRRWAQVNGVSLTESYYISTRKIAEHIEFLFGYGIKTISLYHSTYQNILNRSNEELKPIKDATALFCNQYLIGIINRFHTKVLVKGHLDVIPNEVKKIIDQIPVVSESSAETELYVLIAYNPLEEVLNAARSSKGNGNFIECLWVPKPLDLVIRTGGAALLSNFLPLQAGYARLYFLDKLFNDVDLEDYKKILHSFQELTRKYGE